MSLCHLCSALTAAELFPPNIYYHCKDIAALETSKSSCKCCLLIHYSSLRTGGVDRRLKLVCRADVFEALVCGKSQDSNSRSIKLQIVPGHRDKEGNENEIMYVGIWEDKIKMENHLMLAVEEGKHIILLDTFCCLR
jgi:hypothetical protein